ncbi:MAG: hypothetical protein J6S10_04780, partial [Clostridia bacterium]|nr:hypothetical protein [Clostridia bacterium]
EEGGRGAERGNGEGFAQDNEGSCRTGWESERESFRSYRQKNTSGRGTVVAPTRAHGSTDAVSTALMGARGIANVGNIIEDDGEESEEEKREREARNAGSVAGVLVGGAVGAVIELSQPKPSPTDDADDGEDEGFEISM